MSCPVSPELRSFHSHINVFEKGEASFCPRNDFVEHYERTRQWDQDKVFNVSKTEYGVPDLEIKLKAQRMLRPEPRFNQNISGHVRWSDLEQISHSQFEICHRGIKVVTPGVSCAFHIV